MFSVSLSTWNTTRKEDISYSCICIIHTWVWDARIRERHEYYFSRLPARPCGLLFSFVLSLPVVVWIVQHPRYPLHDTPTMVHVARLDRDTRLFTTKREGPFRSDTKHLNVPYNAALLDNRPLRAIDIRYLGRIFARSLSLVIILLITRYRPSVAPLLHLAVVTIGIINISDARVIFILVKFGLEAVCGVCSWCGVNTQINSISRIH